MARRRRTGPELAEDLISEKALQNYVVELGHTFGWKIYHQVDMGKCPVCQTVRYSKRIGPGFPDLVMAHDVGRTLFVELKSEKGPVQPEQKFWMEMLSKGSNEVYLWRPSDMDTLTQILDPRHKPPRSLTLEGLPLSPYPSARQISGGLG